MVYAYFFLFLPQSWSLNDDYGQVKDWALHADFNPWKTGLAFFQGRLGEGRFLLVDSFLRTIRFKYLPTNPVYFRATQFLLLFLALLGFIAFIRRIGFSKLQIIYASMLVVASLTIKEWIVLTASAETIATPFFFLALAACAYGRRWLGVLLFILSFFSKESFVVLAPAFWYAVPFSEIGQSWASLRSRIRYGVPFLVSSALFLVYTAGLPRVYTGGSHFSHLSVKDLLIGLIVPPLKCYGLAILFSGLVYLRFQRKPFKKWETRDKLAVLTSLSIIVPFSLFLGLWGKFDSWFYLHQVLPFAWAMLLAVPLGFAESALRAEEKKGLDFGEEKVLTSAGIALAVFCLMISMRSAFNRWNSLSEAKFAASMACEDFSKVPGLQVFTNCEEGASQLQNYLSIYDKECPTPPKFIYTDKGLPNDVKAPYEIIVASKFCNTDGSEFNNLAVSERHKLTIWSVLKRLED